MWWWWFRTRNIVVDVGVVVCNGVERLYGYASIAHAADELLSSPQGVADPTSGSPFPAACPVRCPRTRLQVVNMALALLLGLGLVGTTMAGCVGGSDGAGPVIHCNCTPPSTCHYNGFPMPIVRGDVVPHPDLPCPPCGHDTCACPLPPPAPPPPLPPPAPRGQCVVQNTTVFNDGNLYGNRTSLPSTTLRQVSEPHQEPG